jgi:GNAT superfamily N-acetyltransferase
VTTTVRPPRFDELASLQVLEVASGRAFLEVGMPEIAGDEGLAAEVLERYRAAGRAWVLDVDGAIAGFVVVDVLDGVAHVEQISIDPDHARQGLGRILLDHVAEWARARGDARVTLTTFRDVAWNAPYYERCGYRILDDAERGPELIAQMDIEAAHGLDPETRVAMALDLVQSGP